MNNTGLAVLLILGSMVSETCMAEDMKTAPRVYGQPVPNAQAAAQPAPGAPASEPSVSAGSAVSATPQPATSPPPAAQPSLQPASNKAKLTFMDSKLFDVRLGKELESGKDTIEVDVSGRVPLSNIPERMDRWIVKSAEEGKVELLQSEPAPKTRFIFSLIPMVFNAVGYMKGIQEEKMFDQARKYDTKIYYKKDDSGETLIEKVVMTRRKP